eukprot:gene1177-32511_t
MPSRGLFLFLALLATITRSATTLDLEADIPHVSKCNFCELCDGKPGLAHRRLLPVEDGGIHRPNGGGQREYAGFPRSNGEGQREPHQLTDEQLDMMLSEMKGSGHVDAQELELHEHEWDSWAAVTQAASGGSHVDEIQGVHSNQAQEARNSGMELAQPEFVASKKGIGEQAPERVEDSAKRGVLRATDRAKVGRAENSANQLPSQSKTKDNESMVQSAAKEPGRRHTQIQCAATAAALEECSSELFLEYSTASKPTLRKRGSGAGVVRWEAFVQLAARVKTVAITEGNQLSAEQLADQVFNSFGGLFTNPLHARNKLRLSKFHAAIPRLLRLVAVDPLDFIHLHRNGYFKAGKPSSTTASRTLNSQDSSRTSSQTDTSTSSQMDTGISSQTDTSTSSQMDTDFMEDEDFSVCSADEYKSSPDHILFEVSVQYPWRDLAISAPRVQFEVAPSTPSSLKATACNMFKTLLSAQFPTTLTN